MARIWFSIVGISSSRLGIKFGTIAACVLLAACTKAPEYFISEAVVGAHDHSSLLLLPLNVDGEIPHYVSDSTDLLEESLVAYLDRHQKQVKQLSFSATRKEWRAAVAQAIEQRGESTASAEALPVARQLLAKKLAAQEGVDAVIFQGIHQRSAKYSGNAAKWDGIKRRQLLDWNGPKSWGDTTQTFTGETPALSLRIQVHSASGDEVFSRFAGIELTQLIKVVDFNYYVEMRTDLLTDDVVMQESVARAFSPYLEMPVE